MSQQSLRAGGVHKALATQLGFESKRDPTNPKTIHESPMDPEKLFENLKGVLNPTMIEDSWFLKLIACLGERPTRAAFIKVARVADPKQKADTLSKLLPKLVEEFGRMDYVWASHATRMPQKSTRAGWGVRFEIGKTDAVFQMERKLGEITEVVLVRGTTGWSQSGGTGTVYQTLRDYRKTAVEKTFRHNRRYCYARTFDAYTPHAIRMSDLVETKLDELDKLMGLQFIDLTKQKEYPGRRLVEVSANLLRYTDIAAYGGSEIIRTKSDSFLDVSKVSCRAAKLDPGVRYMASSAPVVNRINTYVEILHEQKIDILIMLTKLREEVSNGGTTEMVRKADQYWKDGYEERWFPKGEIMQMKTLQQNKPKDSEVHPTTELRTFLLRRKDEQLPGNDEPSIGEHTTHHFLFNGWPDHGVPTVRDFDDLFKRYRERRATLAASLNRKVRVMVHCSAGVGRTGTFILIDSLNDKYVASTKPETTFLDFFDYTWKMRRSRPDMVQTKSQYQFAAVFLRELGLQRPPPAS
jgi:protein tyrosine phosphatase